MYFIDPMLGNCRICLLYFPNKNWKWVTLHCWYLGFSVEGIKAWRPSLEKAKSFSVLFEGFPAIVA